MDAIKRINPIVALGGGVILGVLLGMALFWGPFAVKWTNAHSYDLAPEAKADYVALMADAYQTDRDHVRMSELLAGWTPQEKQQAFADAIQAYDTQGRTDRAQAVLDLALVLGISLPSGTAQEPIPTPAQPSGLLDRLRVPCLVFVLVLLALVLGMIGVRMLRQRPAAKVESGPPSASVQPVIRTEERKEAGEASVGRWITTYKLGEDAYDESFPIETPTGEYLGECGVGTSETIGATEPDQVTAFEVWLFDKSDIRTVTKVLMSEYAFQDDTSRAKLASKGEAVLAQLNKPFALETNGLQVQATVTDLEYGEGEAPNSFFSRLTIELTATAKPTESDHELLR